MCVQSPEHLVHKIHVQRVCFQFKQRGLKFRQQIKRFFPKLARLSSSDITSGSSWRLPGPG
jgi:hypothetical protein